jgi:cob(I)alamin adenosyltransferase
MLETWIDELDAVLPPLQAFILPGGSTVGALLHQARTTCRRAERWIVSLKETEAVPEAILAFINRLSDYLFTAARRTNQLRGIPETLAEIRLGTHASGNGSAKLQ